jgi:O-antigen/teichoic acid export membrane protein
MKIIDRIKKSLDEDQFEFFSHSFRYFLGSVLVKALSFISIPIMTRLLIPEEYGLIAIVDATTQVLIVFMMLNFHSSMIRYYHDHKNEISTYLTSTFVFLFFYNLVIMVVLFYFRREISIFISIDSKLFILSIIISFSSILITIYLSYLQTSSKSKKYNIIIFFRSLFSIGLSILLIVLLSKDKYLGQIYAMIIINSIFSFYVICSLLKLLAMKFDFSKVKYALKYGVPLIPHALSGIILVQFDRLILNQLIGSYDVGIYSFAYNVGILMNIVVMALNKSWVPMFYKKLSKHEYKKINNISIKYTAIILFIALGLILFSKELVIIFADSAYYSALDLVPIIVLSYVFVYFYTIYANYSFYRKKTIIISLNTIIAGSINIILNYVFIPQYGSIGAAYTTLFSYIMLFILHFIYTKFFLKENCPSLFSYLRSILFFILLLGIYFIFSRFELHFFINIIMKLILLLLFIVHLYKVLLEKGNKIKWNKLN